MVGGGSGGQMPGNGRDQTAVVAFLARPDSYGTDGPVSCIDTHISHLFLAGDRAYKLKRAVRFPYLDFTTLEARRQACISEIAINRRTAPALYLGVVPVLARDGGFTLGPIADAPDARPDAAEFLTVMRRFDQDALFDRMARRGALTMALIESLGARLAAFHSEARPIRPGDAPWPMGAAAFKAATAEVNSQVAQHTPALFPPDKTARLATLFAAALERAGPVLDRRAAEGCVRQCHGDLHLRNICLIDGEPTMFDAIEFNERISTIDILYDSAFLLMDLLHHGLGAEANRLFNDLMAAENGYDGLAALPLLLACRAGIRAHVSANMAAVEDEARDAAKLRDEARAYLDLALRSLAPTPARLIAIGGLSGTGKSTLARALAPGMGAVPGAVVLRSDVIRKRIAGVASTDRLGSEFYSAEMSARVYGAIYEAAEQALEAGYTVIADAVFGAAHERAAVAGLAQRLARPFHGLWLEAPLETLMARVRARVGDASDANEQVVARQMAELRPPGDWRRLEADGGAADLQAQARDILPS